MLKRHTTQPDTYMVMEYPVGNYELFHWAYAADRAYCVIDYINM